MSSVFHRIPKRHLPVAVKGEGMYIFDKDGKRYIDGYAGGACVSCLGHSQETVIEAVRDQIGKMAFFHSAMFTSEPLEELASILTTNAPEGLTRVFFTNSGSEAVETAIMMARQYFVEIGQPQRKKVIGRRNSYHGGGLTGLAVGYQVARRTPFEEVLPNVFHVSPCYEYRGRLEGETLEQYGLRVANELEQAILGLGPNTIMAFIAETVTGTTNGTTPAVPGYFKRVREICDKYGVLLVLDEVFCGLGRTGTLHACEKEGVAPDFLTFAKGIAAGYQPIGATMVNQKIYDAIVSGSGTFKGGYTYSGHATACAAAIAVQKVLRAPGFLDQVKTTGSVLSQRLNDRFGQHPHIGDIRGRGMMMTLELVDDRSTKAPFAPSYGVSSKIYQSAQARGLITHALSGTVDGHIGDHVVICPPLIATGDHIDTIVGLLGEAIDAALLDRRANAA
ncbi:aspartate aminotransferase family protein [Sinorhizobium meliloti]|uniref:aspartate aminotransferase family protein n=1 Tax=Rhizobium meliloti TaxID=382 RepID=UPI000FDC2F61|nr:aspartate aminotransferase family protein [Sinorhizobium meliloti]MDE3775531.1 aspartate aminotransferase family protein [Sinorhizobium meliloti]RVK64711.1 aspartate aminotransferase family protein [Sinorhizobium meliloti]